MARAAPKCTSDRSRTTRSARCSARIARRGSCRTSALLDEAGHPFDEAAVLSGDLSPVFFGSALTNFGVEPFLREFLELAPEPAPRESTAGIVDPTGRTVHGLRVQDPGEHGREAPRSRRVRAHLLGPIRGGHAGEARAHGQA